MGFICFYLQQKKEESQRGNCRTLSFPWRNFSSVGKNVILFLSLSYYALQSSQLMWSDSQNVPLLSVGAATGQNQQSGTRVEPTFRSAWPSAQSNHSSLSRWRTLSYPISPRFKSSYDISQFCWFVTPQLVCCIFWSLHSIFLLCKWILFCINSMHILSTTSSKTVMVHYISTI